MRDNDRERAFFYLQELTNEKGKKARIAIAGAFREMLNRVFDQFEETRKELSGWLTSHNWPEPLPEGIVTTTAADQSVFKTWRANTDLADVIQESTTEAE